MIADYVLIRFFLKEFILIYYNFLHLFHFQLIMHLFFFSKAHCTIRSEMKIGWGGNMLIDAYYLSIINK